MTGIIRRFFVAMLISVAVASPAPAVPYDSMLNIYFDDTSGLISIRDIDLAFAPKEQINAAVALVNSEKTVVRSHKFFPDPRWREALFARLNAGGAADFKVTEPGIYNIVFVVDGKPIPRLPVRSMRPLPVTITSTGKRPTATPDYGRSTPT